MFEPFDAARRACRLAIIFIAVSVSCTSSNVPAAHVPASADEQPGPSFATSGIVQPSATPMLRPSPSLTPRDAVLALADLPPGFGLSEERDDYWDVFGGAGREAGWLIFYRRSALAGVTLIFAEATKWTTADAAKAEIAEGVRYTTERMGWGVQVPLDQTIGDDSYAVAFHDAASDETMYTILFRASNWTNLVTVKGRGMVDLSTAVELATKQLARLHLITSSY
jgi:hypothetical protein